MGLRAASRGLKWAAAPRCTLSRDAAGRVVAPRRPRVPRGRRADAEGRGWESRPTEEAAATPRAAPSSSGAGATVSARSLRRGARGSGRPELAGT